MDFSNIINQQALKELQGKFNDILIESSELFAGFMRSQSYLIILIK